MAENTLIGKTVTGVKVAADRRAILFEIDEGDVIAKADADCCSYTWIEHIELPALGLPAKVTAVEDLILESPATQRPDPEDHDVMQYYGCKISTDRGEIIIDYRNDSNGYYGGDLVWPGESFYGGVFGQNKSDLKWRDVDA